MPEALPLPSANVDARSTYPSKAERDRKTHADARFGNYHSYYAKFRQQEIPDTRLMDLPAYVLTNARVLDLGCNAGKLTAEVMQHCGAVGAVGIDIDPYLIEQAKIAYPDGPCAFEHFDFLDASAYAATAAEGKFDVVLLLSVTKWVHLNHGDAGMTKLFKLLHSVLRSGGFLVLEPQPFSNYARAVKRNKELRVMYKTLQIQPPFSEELQAAGFQCILEIEREEEGFARPLHIWESIGSDNVEGTSERMST